jgi:CheY-like chemotaxis protein
MLLRENPDGAQHATEEGSLDDAFTDLNLVGKRILVAEDNAINQLIMQELIAPSGATVVMADNGQHAVDAVRTQKFDLVFMDMQMPVMGGLEATRIIRTLAGTNELPIIAVTANAMKEDKDNGFAAGMNDYITKPIEPPRLLEILRILSRAHDMGEKTANDTGTAGTTITSITCLNSSKFPFMV